MEVDYYFKFLEMLEKRGFFGELDLSKELQNHFSDKTDFPDVIHTTIHKYVEDFLNDLKVEGYIKFINYTPQAPFTSNKEWVKKIKATGSITPKGVLFLYEKRKIDQAIRGNILTKRFIGATVVIGLVSCIISAVNLRYTINNPYDKTLILTLQERIIKQEQEIKLLKQSFGLQNLDKPILHQKKKTKNL